MGVMKLICDDHKSVITQLEALLAENKKVKREFFEAVCLELQGHMDMEEELLYPKLKQLPELEGHVEQAIRDHKKIKQHLQDFLAYDLERDIQGIRSKIQTVLEVLNAHVDMEENEMVPVYIDKMSQSELDKLYEQLMSHKKAFLEKQKV